jgi:hypothetical protein
MDCHNFSIRKPTALSRSTPQLRCSGLTYLSSLDLASISDLTLSRNAAKHTITRIKLEETGAHDNTALGRREHNAIVNRILRGST